MHLKNSNAAGPGFSPGRAGFRPAGLAGPSHLIGLVVTETFELLTKRCAKFDSLFVNIQLATACSLEKVNFKV